MQDNTVEMEGVMPKLYVVSLNKFAVLFMGTGVCIWLIGFINNGSYIS